MKLFLIALIVVSCQNSPVSAQQQGGAPKGFSDPLGLLGEAGSERFDHRLRDLEVENRRTAMLGFVGYLVGSGTPADGAESVSTADGT